MADGKIAVSHIILAASGGGHARQLLDLEPFWKKHNFSFVTEKTALGKSIASEYPTEFVAHFAAGQLKLKKPLQFFKGLARNIAQSWRIIARKRPDIVLTTGAGSMVFIILFARLRGAKIVLVDSFARFESPSLFARIGGPLAHLRVSQSARSAKTWKGAVTFDPLQIETAIRPPKKARLFATVGATLPFPRLTEYVLNAKRDGLIGEQVLLQIGDSPVEPVTQDGVVCVRDLPFEKVYKTLAESDLVVCHGGTGSLITALQHQCRVIAIPRLHDQGEHYDDHQLEITEAFAARGLIQVARTEAEFRAALSRARKMEPKKVRTDYSALTAYLDRYFSVG